MMPLPTRMGSSFSGLGDSVSWSVGPFVDASPNNVGLSELIKPHQTKIGNSLGLELVLVS